jgi:hypothetical protein
VGQLGISGLWDRFMRNSGLAVLTVGGSLMIAGTTVGRGRKSPDVAPCGRSVIFVQATQAVKV